MRFGVSWIDMVGRRWELHVCVGISMKGSLISSFRIIGKEYLSLSLKREIFYWFDVS